MIMIAHTVIGIAMVMSGAIALMSKKGSTVHRLAGKHFVVLLLLMGLVVAAGAWFEPGSISNLGLVFVCFISYLVLTSWHTMRTPESVIGVWDYLAPVAGLCICVTSVLLGLAALDNPIETENAPPVAAYFFFATLALVATIMDINHIRLNGVKGKHRLARHLWRMNCAMFFCTSTLFTGPGSFLFPTWARDSTAMMIPQSLVIAVCLYWLWKLFASGRNPIFGRHKNTQR